jgi:hypothetical protein
MSNGTEGNMPLKELIDRIKTMSKTDQNKIRDEIGDKTSKESKAILDYTKEQLTYQKEISEILAKNAEYLGDLTERNKHKVDLLEKEIQLELQARRDLELEAARLEENTEERKKREQEIAENYSEQLKTLTRIKEIGSEEEISLTEMTDELQKKVDLLREESKIKKGTSILDKAGVTIHKDIAKTLGISVKVQDTFLGQLGMIGNLLESNKELQGQILAGLKAQVLEAFHYRKIAASVLTGIISNTKEMFNDFDKAQASLAAATGQGREFNDVLYDVGQNGLLFGVTMADAGKAIADLVSQTSNFTALNKAAQAEIATTVAKMEKLGVSTGDAAAIFQNFNQGLGITATESIKMQRDLAMAGVEVGIGAQKITKDFNASLSTLMVYGRQSIDVFKGIAAAAKAAGVETSTLLNLAGKFDTFSGAAEGASKLNALLGTQLSTTELLMATEDERIRMLVESVQSQGVAFKDMDRFTQKAIANAAGISDMAEANRIFGMSLKAYDENERKLKASADAQKKFDDAVAKTVPVMEKFKKLGASIIVTLEPIFNILGGLADNMTEFFNSMKPENREVFGAVLAGFSALVFVIPIITKLVGLLKLFSTATPLASKAADASGKSLGNFAKVLGKGLGRGLSAASIGLAKFGAALVPIGIVVGGVTLAITALVTAVAALGSAFGTNKFDVQTEEAKAKIAEFESRSAEAMSNIVTGDHVGALASIKAMVEEVNKIGSSVEVRSTIENLALITAGQATSMTGERIVANQVSVVSNVNNVFKGMTMTLNVDGKSFTGFVEDIAADVGTGSKQ